MKNNIFLLIIAILSFCLWYFVKPAADLRPKAAQFIEPMPQEYMVNAFITIFATNGFVKEKLSTNHWAYLPATERSLLTLPHLTVYKPDGITWCINAKEGWTKQPTLGTIEQIELQNEVVIERLATANVLPIKLESNQIKYSPKKQFAENDQLVKITKPGLTITGVGLRAFLDRNFVELLQNVKAHYISQKRNNNT